MHGVVVVPEGGRGLVVGVLGQLRVTRQHRVLRPAVLAAPGQRAVQVHRHPRGQRGHVGAGRAALPARPVPLVGLAAHREGQFHHGQRVLAGEFVGPGDAEPLAPAHLDGRPRVVALVGPDPGVRQLGVQSGPAGAHADGAVPDAVAFAQRQGRRNPQRVLERGEFGGARRGVAGRPGQCDRLDGAGRLAGAMCGVSARAGLGRRGWRGVGRSAGQGRTAHPVGEHREGGHSGGAAQQLAAAEAGRVRAAVLAVPARLVGLAVPVGLAVLAGAVGGVVGGCSVLGGHPGTAPFRLTDFVPPRRQVSARCGGVTWSAGGVGFSGERCGRRAPGAGRNTGAGRPGTPGRRRCRGADRSRWVRGLSLQRCV